MPLVKHIKQVLSRLEERLQDIKNRPRENDDTVESQAKTFRIWMWSSAAGLSLIVMVSVFSMDRSKATPTEVVAETSMLDRLPEGLVIAPIEPTNIDSLDSIFDQHGYADLYQTDANGGKGRKLARALPLIRAPKNPRRFAVLVSENQSDLLGKLGEPVLVVLRKKPAKTNDDREKKRSGRDSPLLRDRAPNLDLIEELLPITAQAEEGAST